MNDRIAAAAQGLLAARQENRIALLDPEIAPRDLAEAYAVHVALLDLLSANGGGPRIGWKVGFTNDAALARMGAKEPVLAGLLGQHS
jgi:2-keto-4-pentenoate hydratase